MILLFGYPKKVGINEFVGGQSKATFSCYQATRWDQHQQIYVFGREIKVYKVQSPKAVIWKNPYWTIPDFDSCMQLFLADWTVHNTGVKV